MSENLERIRVERNGEARAEEIVQNIAGTMYAAGSDTVSTPESLLIAGEVAYY